MSEANTGFRGSFVQIADIDIRGKGGGTIVKYRALFTDAEGHVHAHTMHEVEVSEDPAFVEHLRALRDACRAHAENIHFSSPASSPLATKEKIARGIAEAVSGVSDASDEPGEAG